MAARYDLFSLYNRSVNNVIQSFYEKHQPVKSTKTQAVTCVCSTWSEDKRNDELQYYTDFPVRFQEDIWNAAVARENKGKPSFRYMCIVQFLMGPHVEEVDASLLLRGKPQGPKRRRWPCDQQNNLKMLMSVMKARNVSLRSLRKSECLQPEVLGKIISQQPKLTSLSLTLYDQDGGRDVSLLKAIGNTLPHLKSLVIDLWDRRFDDKSLLYLLPQGPKHAGCLLLETLDLMLRKVEPRVLVQLLMGLPQLSDTGSTAVVDALDHMYINNTVPPRDNQCNIYIQDSEMEKMSRSKADLYERNGYIIKGLLFYFSDQSRNYGVTNISEFISHREHCTQLQLRDDMVHPMFNSNLLTASGKAITHLDIKTRWTSIDLLQIINMCPNIQVLNYKYGISKDSSADPNVELGSENLDHHQNTSITPLPHLISVSIEKHHGIVREDQIAMRSILASPTLRHLEVHNNNDLLLTEELVQDVVTYRETVGPYTYMLPFLEELIMDCKDKTGDAVERLIVQNSRLAGPVYQ